MELLYNVAAKRGMWLPKRTKEDGVVGVYLGPNDVRFPPNCQLNHYWVEIY